MMASSCITIEQRDAVFKAVQDLYNAAGDLPFHGWHHVEFVYRKSAVFADDLGADGNLVQVSALVHDLNYLAKKNMFTRPDAGQVMRAGLLHECGLSDDLIAQIEDIVITGEIGRGGEHLSAEAKALSDADTLFKALPITPVLFASRFVAQTGYSIRKLSDKVLSDQQMLIEKDIYFYSEKAKGDYNKWARINLDLWLAVKDSFNDPDIVHMLQSAGIDCD